MKKKQQAKRKFGLGVFVCLFNQDFSKMLLIKRSREKRKQWGADWGNLGGKVELGETSLEACLREAKEEAGIDLTKSGLKLLRVKETPFFTPEFHALHFVYGGTIDEKTKITLNDESEECRWFPLDKLPEKTLDKKEELVEIADKMRKIKGKGNTDILISDDL